MIHALDGGTDNDYFDLTVPHGGPGKQLRAAVRVLKAAFDRLASYPLVSRLKRLSRNFLRH